LKEGILGNHSVERTGGSATPGAVADRGKRSPGKNLQYPLREEKNLLRRTGKECWGTLAYVR